MKKKLANDSLPIDVYFLKKYLSWWKNIEKSYQSEPVKVQQNAYLNFLMSMGIINELENEHFLKEQTIVINPSRQNLINIWRKIPGIRIEIGNTSFLFLPCNNFESTFKIPQEWVDILPVQYYIAVNIDQENNELEILGGTTYNKITKEPKNYNQARKYYETDQLLAWSTIIVARKHCPEPPQPHNMES